MGVKTEEKRGGGEVELDGERETEEKRGGEVELDGGGGERAH